MEYLYSKFVGTPVFLESGGRPLCRLENLLIDSDNGKVVAFGVAPHFKKIISPMDVRLWTSQILIRDHDDIVSYDEILNAQRVVEKNIPILGNKVYSQEGDYLGKVFDYAVHPQMLILTKIFVAKSILGLVQLNRRIIPYSCIYEIMPKKIIVKTDAEVYEDDREGQKVLNLDPA